MAKYRLKKDTIRKMVLAQYPNLAQASIALFDRKHYLTYVLSKNYVNDITVNKLSKKLNKPIEGIAFEVRYCFPER